MTLSYRGLEELGNEKETSTPVDHPFKHIWTGHHEKLLLQDGGVGSCRTWKADRDGNKMSIKIFFSGSDVLPDEKLHPKKGFFLPEIYLYRKKWIHFSSIPFSKYMGVFYTGVIQSHDIS